MPVSVVERKYKWCEFVKGERGEYVPDLLTRQQVMMAIAGLVGRPDDRAIFENHRQHELMMFKRSRGCL